MARVTLESMTQAHYTDFMEALFPPYAAERAAADHVSVRVAAQYARLQRARLLPDGHLTAGHRFVRVLSTDGGQSTASGAAERERQASSSPSWPTTYTLSGMRRDRSR